MFSRLLALLFLIGVLVPLPVAAQAVNTGHLEARLVRQTEWAPPGSTVYVAVVQDIEPGWHTYWINAGDVGRETELGFTPPPGFQIGDPVWPLPQRMLTLAGQTRLSSYAYEGRVVTPVPVAVPAFAKAGTSVPIRLQATFYVCSETLCVPESAVLSLELPIREGRPPLDGQWGGIVSRALDTAPQPAAIEGRVSTAGGMVSFAFVGDELAAIEADGAYFLPDRPGVIDQAAAQRVERGPRGLVLTAPAAQTLVPLSGPVGGILSTAAGAWRVSLEAGRPPTGSHGLGPAQPAALNGPLGAVEPGLGLMQSILFAFLGGLILNVMPCVFPILSMKAASLAGAATRPTSARAEGLAFLAGVLVAFLALGALLIALRAGGEAAGWGFQLQNPAVVAGLVLVMLAAGLNLSGVFHTGASAQRLGSEARESLEGPLARLSPWAGSALTGILAVVVAAPCTAPFMAAAVGFAAVQPAPVALAVFASLGLGFALPFVLISLSPALMRALPRPGPWLETAKAFLALPMYAAAFWLGWVFWRQAGITAALILGGTALVAALALFLWGRRQTAEMQGWRRPPSLVVTAAFAFLAVGGLVWASVAPRDVTAAGEALAGDAWSPERLATLRAEGRPVLVNFTADWCLSCKTNEAAALSSRRVADALEGTNAAYLVADWTRRDDAIAAELARHGRSGVPLYLVYPAGGGEPEVLPQLLTDGMVAAALERAASS